MSISLPGILTSSFMKKFSPRVITVSGGIILALSTLLNSFAPNIYVLYVTQGVLEGKVQDQFKTVGPL